MIRQSSQDDFFETLYQRAVALFGRERAEALRPSLQERAEQLWLVAQASPEWADEPPFGRPSPPAAGHEST